MAFNKRSEIRRPRARSERLLIEHIDDETVVYDEESKTAHALKPLAAAVFLYADGRKSVSDIAELAALRLGGPVSEVEVVEAIEQLRGAALLDEPELVGAAGSDVSRRTALKTFAAAGVAVSAGSLLVTSVATAASPSNSNCPGSGYSASTLCGTNGAVIGSCTPCHQQSDCSSGYVCAMVPCDGNTSGCAQSVCVPTNTATSDHFTTFPVGAKYCPSGWSYFLQAGYQYKCCEEGTYWYNAGCPPTNLYTSMFDGSLSCGCSGTIVNGSECCPSGNTVVNGVCTPNHH